MSIYVPTPLEGCELCHPVRPEGFEAINVSINGESRSQQWRSPEMQIIRQDEGRLLSPSDSPWLGAHALILRPRALDALNVVLAEHGELLPLQCGEDDLVIYNATRVIEALDDRASAITRFLDGKIMMIKRYAFRADLLRNIHVFKIPNLRVSPTFVSRTFVDAWADAGLDGLGFKQVWVPN
jgi:hypothetical protein